MPERTLIFLHLHKTAGTTLMQVLRRQYPAETIHAIDPFSWERWPDALNELQAVRVEQRRCWAALTGHMYFGLHRLLPQPATYITLLRDPIERVISLYYYIRREPKVGELHRQVTTENLSLAGFVESGLSPLADNGQTRFLAGLPDIRYGQCDAALLAQARDNLQEHFCLVGLSERFEDTLIMAEDRLGWRLLGPSPRLNVTAQRPFRDRSTLPVQTLAVIEQYNRLDRQLYQEVTERFTAEWSERWAILQPRLVLYRLLQSAHSLIKGRVWRRIVSPIRRPE